MRMLDRSVRADYTACNKWERNYDKMIDEMIDEPSCDMDTDTTDDNSSTATTTVGSAEGDDKEQDADEDSDDKDQEKDEETESKETTPVLSRDEAAHKVIRRLHPTFGQGLVPVTAEGDDSEVAQIVRQLNMARREDPPKWRKVVECIYSFHPDRDSLGWALALEWSWNTDFVGKKLRTLWSRGSDISSIDVLRKMLKDDIGEAAYLAFRQRFLRQLEGALTDDLPADFPFELGPIKDDHLGEITTHKATGVMRVFVDRTHRFVKHNAKSVVEPFYVYDSRKCLWLSQTKSYIASLVNNVMHPYLASLDDDIRGKIETLITDPTKLNSMMGIVSELYKVKSGRDFAFKLNTATALFPIAGGLVVDLKRCETRQRTAHDMFTFEVERKLIKTDLTKDDDDVVELQLINGYYIKLCMSPVTDDAKELAKLAADKRYLRDTPKEKRLKMNKGYTITGEAHMRKFDIILGSPGTGKSKFIEAVRTMMGKVLSVKGSSGLVTGYTKVDPHAHTAGLNKAEGRRLLYMVEAKKGIPLKIDDVLGLVGDAELDIRNLNQEAREIINTLKMWLVANHMPIIPEDRLDEILPKLDIIELNHVMDTKDAANIAFVKDVMTSDLFLDQMFTMACRWAKRFYDQGQTFPIADCRALVAKYTGSTYTKFKSACLVKEVDENGAPVKAAFISSKDLISAYEWFCKEDQKFDVREHKVLGSHAVGLEIARDFVEDRQSVMDETLKKKVQLYGRIGVRWNVEYLSRSARVHLCKCEAIKRLGEKGPGFRIVNEGDDIDVE